ncbi:MAG: bifunctional phosphopantothenoylcysteine decarboxylase/phosphopantothenate--cysteine ligase CoaBC [Beijerinckiaceae bacterium]
MSGLAGKSILLIVSGGIAAYKIPELIRRLREREAGVTVVLTAAAKHFVTPLTLASVSGSKVYDDLFSLTDETEMGHIELSRSADLVVVAPATANIIAKNASGLADDLASTLLLATDKAPIFVPAMNVRMWEHPATQRNIEAVKAAGSHVVGPAEGAMACGEFGPGRMLEPLEIVVALEHAIMNSGRASGALVGRKAVVTAGPTREAIDPVRFISNKSSGKQGYAIAAALAAAGAETTLVSGPVDLAAPRGVNCVRVETAEEMLQAVRGALPADIFVAAAAVADWRAKTIGGQKTKKGPKGPPTIELTENPDILATLARAGSDRPSLVVGFAAETENLIENAKAKLKRKGCDLIVANDVGAEQQIFGGDRNRVVIVEADGVTPWPQAGKDDVAGRLAALIADRLGAKK